MEIRKETKWLCENARTLEKYPGQWVSFSTADGTMKKDGSLPRLLRSSSHLPREERPFVFHVPSKRDLLAPITRIRRR